MAGEEREADADLSRLRALGQTPEKYHIFQALRLIEAAYDDHPRLGRSKSPSQDPVRLGQTPAMAFPTSTISSFDKDPESGRHQLSQYVFGLFGPHGALPLHLTDYARDRSRNHRDKTLSAFADVFHHRMISLFYRAWATGEPAPSFDRPDDDPFGAKLDAIAGIDGEAFKDRDAMPDLAKRHFAGLMSAAPRSEAGLAAVLKEFFRSEVTIESFIGSWLHLESHDRGQLGAAALGGQASLGEKVWSREAKFRVRIGPLSLADYERLLPDGEGQKRLAAIIRNYAGDALEWEANLVLLKSDVPPLLLGESGQLGRTSWIGQREDRDADDLCVTPPRGLPLI